MKKFVYILPRCARCGGKAKLEHHGDIFQATYSRVRCTACERHTDWRPTRFQAEIDWEDMTEQRRTSGWDTPNTTQAG